MKYAQPKPRFGHSSTLALAASELSALSTRLNKFGEAVNALKTKSVFFLLFCVAMAAAAPQFITTWPGYAPGFYPYAGSRTLVAGPTVVNGAFDRFVAPGYVGPAFI